MIEAEHVGADSLLSQIVALVSEAQRSRAPLQKLADRIAVWFVPTVIGISIVTFIVWWVVGPEPRLAYALVNAVAVLIIACPCALGLATPISIMVASGRGAQMGVLFRNAEAIETLRNVDTLVLDKTGTLTQGRPALTQVRRTRQSSRKRSCSPARPALSARASIRWPVPSWTGRSREASHRLRSRTSTPSPVRGVAVRGRARAPGLGECGVDARCGRGTSTPPHEASERLRRTGQTIVFLAIDAQLAGILAVG